MDDHRTEDIHAVRKILEVKNSYSNIIFPLPILPQANSFTAHVFRSSLSKIDDLSTSKFDFRNKKSPS